MITSIEAACLFVLVCAAPAFAQTRSQSTASAALLPAHVSEVTRDDERAPDQSQSPSYRWYGWQTLSIDAAWIAMMLVAERGSVTGAELLFGGRPAWLGTASALVSVLGAPAVLFAHGNDWAGPSLALRATSRLLGLVLLFVPYVGQALALAALAAMAGAVIVDAIKAKTRVVPDAAQPQLGFSLSPNAGSLGFSLRVM
jgi:hypothetical protein